MEHSTQPANALPTFFEPMIVEQYGAELARCIAEGCDVRRASSLRANALLAERAEVAQALDAAGIGWQPVSWYDDAFVIGGEGERGSGAGDSGLAGASASEGAEADDANAASRGGCDSATSTGTSSPAHRGNNAKHLWDLPIYDAGKIYLQSLSSMLPPLVLGAEPGIDILDMCAAPGGKTTQLAALGGKGTHITACEMHAPRTEKLEYNLRKQGANNVVVMRTDARQLDDFFRFDRILLDAPCSGSGTLRTRDPKLHARFTQKLIQKSCKSQRALLDKALSLLKPGGTLVYSTCSVLACENEDIVEAALRQAAKRGTYEVQPVELPGAAFAPADQLAADAANASAIGTVTPSTLPILPTRIEGTLCVCPTKLFEGFFVAKIKRVK